jgi:hypothetical protein
VNIIARNEMIVMPMMRRLGRPRCRDVAAAQHHRHRDGQRHQQRQHREPPRDRAVRARHEQPLVADVLVEPAQAGPDGGLEHVGLDLADQRLVPEDQDDRDGGRGHDRRQQRQQPELPGAAVQDGAQRPDGHQQRADRGDAGGTGEQGEGADDAGERHRQQPAGRHPALHRAPGEQDADRDDRLGRSPLFSSSQNARNMPAAVRRRLGWS